MRSHHQIVNTVIKHFYQSIISIIKLRLCTFPDIYRCNLKVVHSTPSLCTTAAAAVLYVCVESIVDFGGVLSEFFGELVNVNFPFA